MSAPIKRLNLEFLPSNISGYESIVKLSFSKYQGFVGLISNVYIEKYIIDKTIIDELELAASPLIYMSDSVYMDENNFIGGTAINEFAKDKATLFIDSMQLSELDFFLDYVLSGDDLLVYVLKYTYKNIAYTTPMIMSYKPIASQPLIEYNPRPCITILNNRFRGKQESDKYDRQSQEMADDIIYLDSIKTEIMNNIETNMTTIDDKLNKVNALKQKMKYIYEEL